MNRSKSNKGTSILRHQGQRGGLAIHNILGIPPQVIGAMNDVFE